MTDQNPTATPAPETTSEEEPKVVQLSRWQQFAVDHPRFTKALLIGGAIGAVGGVGVVATNVKKNSHRIDSAKEHLELAAGEFSEAVSPTSENTDA